MERKGYELRRVRRPREWASYHAIRRAVLFESRGKVGVYDDAHPDERAPSNLPLLLFFHGRAVGTARLDHGAEGAGIIRLVAIAETAQGCGHGRALVGLIVRRARKLGFTALEVHAAADAMGFYQHLGFVLIDGKREAPLLALQLGP